jgi:hypothetical protein
LTSVAHRVNKYIKTQTLLLYISHTQDTTTNTAMELITATEAKRVYRLSDEEIADLAVVINENKKHSSRKYKKSQVELIAKKKADFHNEFPEYHSNQNTLTRMMKKIEMTQKIVEFKKKHRRLQRKKVLRISREQEVNSHSRRSCLKPSFASWPQTPKTIGFWKL